MKWGMDDAQKQAEPSRKIDRVRLGPVGCLSAGRRSARDVSDRTLDRYLFQKLAYFAK